MTVVDVLAEAKVTIHTRGWCQQYLMNSKGEVCLEGAIFAVGNGRFMLPPGAFSLANVAGSEWDVRMAAFELLVETVAANHGNCLPLWNDDPARTVQDVLDALDVAMVIAREREAAYVGV